MKELIFLCIFVTSNQIVGVDETCLDHSINIHIHEDIPRLLWIGWIYGMDFVMNNFNVTIPCLPMGSQFIQRKDQFSIFPSKVVF